MLLSRRVARTSSLRFVWFAFGHVHTATDNISPSKQYCGCAFENATQRGPFGDALAEVDGAVGALAREVDALDAAAATRDGEAARSTLVRSSSRLRACDGYATVSRRVIFRCSLIPVRAWTMVTWVRVVVTRETLLARLD
jgi:hypothetical protein